MSRLEDVGDTHLARLRLGLLLASACAITALGVAGTAIPAITAQAAMRLVGVFVPTLFALLVMTIGVLGLSVIDPARVRLTSVSTMYTAYHLATLLLIAVSAGAIALVVSGVSTGYGWFEAGLSVDATAALVATAVLRGGVFLRFYQVLNGHGAG